MMTSMLEAINHKDHHKAEARTVDTHPVEAEKVGALQVGEGTTTSITMF
jgi:hypothetical protein